ncbi:MAG: hypothetical protein EA374_02915 [Acholeplasmatales bacterium]|nr:MAG: hypothetical protein EA374_02915 [Acholeplasmatales bacterium]
MKKYVFKEFWLNLVLGVVLIVLAILASPLVFDWISEVVEYAVAAIIVFYAVMNFVRHRKKYTNRHASMILAGTLAVGILLAVLLIPPVGQIGVNLAIGLTLYVQGLSYLLIMQLTKQRSTFTTFVLYLVILTLGAYVMFGSPNFGDILKWVLVVLVLTYGIILLIAGILELPKKKK